MISASANEAHSKDFDLILNVSVAKSFQNVDYKNHGSKVHYLNKKRETNRDKNAKRVLGQREIDLGISRFTENPNRQSGVNDLFKIQLNQRKGSEEEKNMINKPVAMQSVAVPKSEELNITRTVGRKVSCYRTERKIDGFQENVSVLLNPPGQRLVQPIKESIFNGAKIETVGLHEHAVKNLADLFNITELTTVQQKTIPKALNGEDLLVRSQTGSGKTLAYALPIVEKLQQIRPKIVRTDGILALVIVPTRELAMQTYELMQKLLKPYIWIVSGVLIGGESRKSEKARLRKGINILIGTPGRLLDHLLNTTSFKLSKLVFFVLDEADRLLEMGYEQDIQRIVEGVDKQLAELAQETNQPLTRPNRFLLSATLTPAVQKLAGLTLHAPVFIDNSEEDAPLTINTDRCGYTKETHDDDTGVLTIPENLVLSYVVVPPKLRLVTLAALLAKEFKNKQKMKVIVFMSTTEMVTFHHDIFHETLTSRVLDDDDEESEKNSEKDIVADGSLLRGVRLFKLHGSMTQTERQGAFKAFRDSVTGLLLTTDVCGRGIDVPDVHLVVQYSPPQKTADFVHRVGRTARAGRSGRAVLFLTATELQFVRNLEDKRLRIMQVDRNHYLQALVDSDKTTKITQQAVSNLHYRFQELITNDKELREKACKAFVSWIKYYTAFPKELKPIFNVKNAHMGHFAKSFGLRDEPKDFVHKHFQPKPPTATNRLTYKERDSDKMQQERSTKQRLFSTTLTKGVRNTQEGANDGFSGGNAKIPSPADSRNSLLRCLLKSRSLNISEYGSGLPMAKKRKTESR